MGWVEWRIKQYNQGVRPNWLERLCLEHANPVNFGFHVLGAIPLIYGLWQHNGGFIFLGMIISFVGHLCSWFMGGKEN